MLTRRITPEADHALAIMGMLMNRLKTEIDNAAYESAISTSKH